MSRKYGASGEISVSILTACGRRRPRCCASGLAARNLGLRGRIVTLPVVCTGRSDVGIGDDCGSFGDEIEGRTNFGCRRAYAGPLKSDPQDQRDITAKVSDRLRQKSSVNPVSLNVRYARRSPEARVIFTMAAASGRAPPA